MKNRMELKDGTIINIESGSSINNIHVIFEEPAKLSEVFDKFNDNNLSEVTIKNSSDSVIGVFKNLTLVSVTSVRLESGMIDASFFLREKTNIELRMDALEEGQSDQDDAILELADIIAGE